MANGKLLAASKDMFEALEAIIRYWDTPAPPDKSINDHIYHIIGLAENAYKKATE